MSKIGLIGWAVAAVAVTLLAIGFGGEDAEAERLAREQAQQAAQQADSARNAALKARDAALDSLARLDSIYADSLAEAQQAAQVAEASATEQTRRLRRTLTADQQRELDSITAYWSTALEEERRATRAAQNQLRVAEAKAAQNLELALAERERADRWKAAFDAAEVEIEALRKPDWGIELDDVPKMLAAAAVGYLAAR